MKEHLQRQRIEKIRTMKQEIEQWQQIVINQELRLDRLECTVTALITTLNKQGRFARFDAKTLNSEVDRIAKARREQVQKQAAQAAVKPNGHQHAGSNPA